MRSLVALALLLLPTLLAGCTGPGGNANLRPPCQDTTPLRIDIGSDKERYRPGELMNVTLTLVNGAGSPSVARYRSWELTMRAFDGHLLRAWVKDIPEGAERTAPGNGRVVLAERWQPFRVTAQLFQPLTPGTYYLCAVLFGVDGSTLAAGARSFIAEPPPNTLG